MTLKTQAATAAGGASPAATSPFKGLIGVTGQPGMAGTSAAEETDDEKKKREEDEKAAAKKKAEQDEEEEKKSKAAAEALRLSAAGGGDDLSDNRDERDDTIAAHRAKERGRVLAILSSAAAKTNMTWAIKLATTTSLSRNTVIGLLEGQEAPAAAAPKDPLRDRMAEQPQPNVGADDGSKPQPNLAQAIIAAGKKRRGETS